MKQITVVEARKLIEQEGLKPADNLWHYSFNINIFYSYMMLEESNGKIALYAPGKVNQWTPLPIFTNFNVKFPTRIEGHLPFWFCRLTTFEDFLKRRSVLSKKPRKHFPTLQTFKRKDVQLKGSLTIDALDENLFINYYDKLRRPEHLNGAETLAVFYRTNLNLPSSWQRMMTLDVHGNVVGVGLIVDDGVSHSLVNLASVLDSNRFGLYMLTLWIKDCCEKGKTCVDAGVSGTYGVYKSQLFLDAKILDEGCWKSEILV